NGMGRPRPMIEPTSNSLVPLLRLVAERTPQPWYPRAYADATRTSPELLDPQLEKLRLAGLIQLTDWVPEYGQGYRLTEEGVRTLQSPRDLARLDEGNLPTQRRESPRPRVRQLPEGPTPWDRGEAVRDALLGPMRPVVNNLLLALN